MRYQSKPSLMQVAQAILYICPNREPQVFVPSDVRKNLKKFFPNTPSGSLSSQIQPHLKTFREHKIIELLKTNQDRNRPYRIIDRSKLQDIARDPNYIFPVGDMSGDDTDGSSNDTMDLSDINVFKRRIATLEEDVITLKRRLDDADGRITLLQRWIQSMTEMSRSIAGLLSRSH